MNKKIVVVGASGFGREALDVLEARRALDDSFAVVGVIDDGPSSTNLERLASRGISFLGTLADWIDGGVVATHFVVGIGSPSIRKSISVRLIDHGLAPFTVVHPSALIGSQTVIGDGAVICAGVVISTNVSIGRQAHINPSATIGHDTAIADFVSINPAATVSGEVLLEEGSLIGAGSTILQGLQVGSGVIVGAGAVVTKSVPANVVVKGVPGRW